MAQNFLTHALALFFFLLSVGGSSPESLGSELLRGSPEVDAYFRDRETHYFRPGPLSPTNSLVFLSPSYR